MLDAQIKNYARGEDTQLSPHFHLREWACHCGKCPHTVVSFRHLQRLEQLRTELERPIKISSGFRCAAHNRACGGGIRSMHLRGLATDIVVAGMKPDEVAALCEHFDGLGRYDEFTHIDSRGRKARWDKRSQQGQQKCIFWASLAAL